MRTSNDQYGRRPNERVLSITRQPPVDEGNRAGRNRYVEKESGCTVG
jgi:hypothetical protein